MNSFFALGYRKSVRSFLIHAILAAILIGSLGFILFFTGVVMANGDEATIEGHKFYDVNGIEGRNDDEPGIDDWGIKLFLADGEGGVAEIGSTETHDSGYYYFGGGLNNGSYILCERQESENWTQTYPSEDTPGVVSCHGFDEELDEELAEWGWAVGVEEGALVGDSENFDFGNKTELGAVRAVKFNDLDRDGARNDNEPGVSDVEICLEPDDLADDFLSNLWDYFFDSEDNEFDECKLTDSSGMAEWTGLPAGEYEIEENVPDGWTPTTSANKDFELGAGESKEFFFGNRQAALIIYKYDYDSEELLPGWEICVYEAIENDGGYEKGELVEPCQKTIDDFDEENGAGQFHGAAVFSPENLDPDRWYIIDEEEKAGWRLGELEEDSLEIDWDYINWDYGQVPIRLDDSFFENAEDARLYLYNSDIAGDITVLKYFDENLGIFIPGWEICLREFDEEVGAPGSIIECKDTDSESGMVFWTNLLPGTYILDEEEREGWTPQGFSAGNFENAEWSEFNSELGQVVIYLYEGGQAEIHFLNWIYDIIPPQSSFEDQFDHRVIDTEIVSLELSGASADLPLVIGGEEERISGSAGVREAALTVRQLGGSELVENYPSSSFFDVFAELRCPAEESIPIEIVALSLTSVDPMTVSWRHNWTPPSSGIYCLEVSARDLAANTERTAYAGPIAYVPVVEISEQTIDTPSESIFTVHWTTSEPATSRVIYDTVSHSTLGEAPNYGYDFSTNTFDANPKVTDHAVAISGLSGGTTYYYRTVSSASPESVGDEGSVTTPSSVNNEGSDDEVGTSSGSSAGSNQGGGGGIIYNTPPGQPLAAPQVLGGEGGGEGQVLGAALTLEEQIEAVKSQIEALKQEAISLMEELIKILEEKLKELMARLP